MFRYDSNRSLILTLGWAVSMFASCAKLKAPALSFDEVRQPKISVAAPDASSVELKDLQVVSAVEAEMAAASMNRFAMDLHRQFAQEKANLFYSPASISVALGMTHGGALGETQKQMTKVLHVPEDQAAWLKSCQQLLPLFNQKTDGFEVSLANRLWGQQGFAFNPAFLTTTQEVWNAPLGDLDFVRQSDTSRIAINQWVEAQTASRIKNLLPPKSITRRTRLVLTNAIYFKADWETRFKKELTKEAAFFVSKEQSVQVPMMFQNGSFRYFENKTLQFLSLPYKAGDLAMEVILPRAETELIDLEQGLTLDELTLWNKAARNCDVEVHFPRFKLNSSFSMKNTLSKMGMERAFSASAEFGGISTEAKLQISEVFHRAFVEVDETGTEAAAATGVVIQVVSNVSAIPSVFRADRPFLILIRHQPTGLILFMGRVTDPR